MADSWQDAIERLPLDLRNVVTRQFETKVITKEGRQELSPVERKSNTNRLEFSRQRE